MDFQAVAGRWNLVVGEGASAHPAWLELSAGPEGLAGRYVGIWGSARPVAAASFADGVLRFSLPVQYEGYPHDLAFEGTLADGRLAGTARVWEAGVPWCAVPAPVLAGGPVRPAGEPVSLIGAGLAGWRSRWPERENAWTEVRGALVNAAVGTDLVSEALFDDFVLDAEYSYPPGSNSGIYLRGRYEVQVLDDEGQAPGVGSSGAVYGFLAPASNAARPAGEVNVARIELVGRTITMDLNGVRIHDRAEIPGITGGALDGAEGAPGPILLQGDHGPVTYHRLVVQRLERA